MARQATTSRSTGRRGTVPEIARMMTDMDDAGDPEAEMMDFEDPTSAPRMPWSFVDVFCLADFMR